MPRDDAAERVRRRLLDWVHRHGHGSRTKIADAVHTTYGASLSRSWVTDLLAEGDPTDLRLEYLDAVAELLDMPPGELVAREGDHYLEVSPTEYRLVRYFRSLPDVIRGHAMAYLDFLFGAHERAQEDAVAVRNRATAAAKLARERIYRDRRRRKA